MLRVLAVATEGAAEVITAYGLFAHPPGGGAGPGTTVPGARHVEFLVDRNGYLRARWLAAGRGEGWDDLARLYTEIRTLARETPSTPAPDEHVH